MQKNKSNNTIIAKNKSNNTASLVSRLKSMLNLRTDLELALFLGVKQNTISTWKAKDKPDWDLLIKKLDNYDLNYIIKGDTFNPKASNTATVDQPPDNCPSCSFLNEALKATQKALEHAESVIGAIQETKSLLIKKISDLESALDNGQKRKSA